MRKKLKKIGNENRHVFYGTFERNGKKNGYKGIVNTILLVNIKDENNNILSDHLWFNETKGFKKLNLTTGDIVRFKGRISSYVKGYTGRRDDIYSPLQIDYRIVFPTCIEKIK